MGVSGGIGGDVVAVAISPVAPTVVRAAQTVAPESNPEPDWPPDEHTGCRGQLPAPLRPDKERSLCRAASDG